MRRSDPDARGNTTDIEYIYMRNRSDRGLELINDRRPLARLFLRLLQAAPIDRHATRTARVNRTL